MLLLQGGSAASATAECWPASTDQRYLLLFFGRVSASTSRVWLMARFRAATDIRARAGAANALAQIRLALGRWERFSGLLQVAGYVASAADFLKQPAVLDGASEFFVRILGSTLGAHARTAFHATRLPINSPLELAVTFTGSTGARGT